MGTNLGDLCLFSPVIRCGCEFALSSDLDLGWYQSRVIPSAALNNLEALVQPLWAMLSNAKPELTARLVPPHSLNYWRLSVNLRFLLSMINLAFCPDYSTNHYTGEYDIIFRIRVISKS
jgi:hypothetical protein